MSVWNGHKFSAGKDNNETAYGYLIDVALFDSIPYVPASPPLFKEELESSWEIDLNSITENPSFQLPEGTSFRDESFSVEISIEGLPEIATFDQETRTMTLDYT